MAGSYGECANVIAQAALFGRNEIREAELRIARGFFELLAEKMESGEDLLAASVRVQLNVVADGVGREKAINAPCLDEAFLDHQVQQFLSIREELAGLFAVLFMLEN